VNGAASYTLYRSTTPGGEGATPLVSGLTATAYVDLTATGAATYYYMLSATSPGGEGARSAEASAYAYVPGDANNDLSVDFLDLAQLAQNYNVGGGSATWAQGDFNGDGTVDFLDLAILAQNYNTTRAPAGAATIASDPEQLAPVAAQPVVAQPVAAAPTPPEKIVNAPPKPTPVPKSVPKPSPKPVVKPITKAAPPKAAPPHLAPPPPPAIFSTQKIATPSARKRRDVLDRDLG